LVEIEFLPVPKPVPKRATTRAKLGGWRAVGRHGQ
jgi:hypothetical protein